jgi:hypothetical protein
MSIGIVALAVIFPVSVLQTVKATQVTNATDLRYNAEAIMDLFPNMIRNPSAVSPNYTYNPNNAATNVATADPPLTQNYVIDPLGYSVIQQNLNTTIGAVAAGLQFSNRPEHYFGNDPGIPSTWNGSAGTGVIARYPLYWRPNPNTGSIAAAEQVATLPDSWVLQLEGFMIPGSGLADPGAAAALGPQQWTQLQVPGVQNAVLNVGPSNSVVRAVIFSADGSASQVRAITSIPAASNIIMWTEDINSNGQLDAGEDLNNNGSLDHYPLPAAFVNSGIGNVRIEIQDRRYTWLITVRQPAGAVGGGIGDVDVVIFFNRKIETIGDDERLYLALFNAGRQIVNVTYTAAAKPFMRKGGFIFDANNAYWYRISNVVDSPANNTAVVTIETPAYASNNVNGAPMPGGGQPRAMFPTAVVDMFPIGSKAYP